MFRYEFVIFRIWSCFSIYNQGKNRNEPNQLGHWLYYPAFGEHKVVAVLTEDENVEKIIQAIKESTNAGKIIVTEIENLIDVANDTIGNQALWDVVIYIWFLKGLFLCNV